VLAAVLALGPELEVPDHRGRTLLQLAAYNGQVRPAYNYA
jgi:hypothetical protein